MKTGDKLLCDIIDFGMDGEGVAKIDGIPIFVPLAVKGDLAKIQIIHLKKDYGFGKLIKVVKPSELRVEPICPVFGICGGCDIQHISQQAQTDFKRDKVVNCFRKSKLDVSVDEVITGNPLYYRNKLQIPFGEKEGRIVCGFFKKNSHEIVPIEKCFLQGEWTTRLISIVTAWANGDCKNKKISAYNEASGKGVLRHMVARFNDGFLSLTLVINADSLPEKDALCALLSAEFEFNLHVSINKKNTNVIFGDQTKKIFGQEKVYDIDGILQQISPVSFLQVNDEIKSLLYGKTVSNLMNADIVFDIYSGAGSLSAQIAKASFSRCNPCVYGIEIVPEATQNANDLMAQNLLSNKVKNINGDATTELPKLVETLVKNGILTDKMSLGAVIDPPRKGCDDGVIQALIKSGIDKIVYISCNPATLARDLAKLSSAYNIISATPYDMFPQTSHIETLVCLARK